MVTCSHTEREASVRNEFVPQPDPPAPVTPEAKEINGDTSDGYHTFRELYAYRKAYNALLFNEWASRGLFDVHKSRKHSDGEPCFGGGWFIVVAQMPTGQISNHYKDEDWDLFRVPERERGNEWDGHTPQVALERLLKLAATPEPQTPDTHALRERIDSAMCNIAHMLSQKRIDEDAQVSFRLMTDYELLRDILASLEGEK